MKLQSAKSADEVSSFLRFPKYREDVKYQIFSYTVFRNYLVEYRYLVKKSYL